MSIATKCLIVSVSLLLGGGHTTKPDKELTFTRFVLPSQGTEAPGPGGINDRGQIVGAISGQGFVLTKGKVEFFSFPSPFYDETAGAGINNRDEIVGYVDVFVGGNCCERHSFLLKSKVFSPIDVPFPGVTETTVSGINDRGQIVGYYRDSMGGHGFVLEDGVFTPIDVPGALDTHPWGINNAGLIVGTYSITRDSLLGFVLDQGEFAEFTGPDGNPALPFDVNDQGQIVGSTGGHGFLYDHGRFRLIDVPFEEASPGSTVVNGINNRGQMTGVYSDAFGHGHSFLAE
jgi:hypothetical protein